MSRESFLVVVVTMALAAACGGAGPESGEAHGRRRTGPDVVTAEWTSGDDAVLDAGLDAGTAPSPK